MTKLELATKIEYRMGLTNRVAKAGVEGIIEVMSQALENGERIEVRDFFSFEARWRDPVTKRNPKTGEPAPIAGKYIPFGKQSGSWAKRMRNTA